MNILSLEAVSKSYGVKPLLDNVTFGVSEGEKIGVIGVNGAGKSTFLKIVAGILPPDQGRVVVGNKMTVQYLPQDPTFEEELTVLDYVFAGDTPALKVVHDYESIMDSLSRHPEDASLQNRLQQVIARMDATEAWDMETHAKTILTKLGIVDFSQKVTQLSGGQKKRVAMARTLIQPSDLLILDEPTNHIDHETVEWLEDYLAKFRGALLIITHDRYFLDRVANEIVELDQAKLFRYEGNYSKYLEQKEIRLQQQIASEDKRKNLLRREMAWLRRGAKARTTKQKARIDRIQHLQDSTNPIKNQQMDWGALGSKRLGKKVLEFKQVTKRLESRTLIKDFNYIVLPDDRVGIIGRNGSGKSTLLNLIAGRIQPDEGEIIRGETVRLSYYDQESLELNPDMKVIDYIKEVAEVIHGTDGSVLTASQMLERFLFPPSMQWSNIGRLSGGEKRRLYLLRKLMEEPNVLLLDEPTNDLDVQTLAILEDYLEHFPGAVIVVSHDRAFLDQSVDHLFHLKEDGTLESFYGTYTDYLEQLKLEQAQEKQEKKIEKSSSAQQLKNEAKARKLSFKEQREFEQIEDRISKLEERIADLDSQIEQAGSDYVLLQSLSNERATSLKELDEALERWAELSEIAEGS